MPIGTPNEENATAEDTTAGAARPDHTSAGPAPEGTATASGAPDGGYVPPPLPAARSNLAHIVIPGTAAWFLGFFVLLFFTDRLRAHDDLIYLWTCLAGGVLGCVGLSIYLWQRAAARRGARSANRMALDEKL